MKLLVVRHGQTDANAGKFLQGSRIDESLNEAGREQANAVVPLLQNTEINAIYSSELKRAYQTAQIIAQELKMEVSATSFLNEKDFGNLSGKTWDQVHQEYHNHQLRCLDRSHAYDYRPQGGESVDQVRQRVASFFNNIKDKYPEQNVLAVTHGGIIRLVHDMLEVEQPPHIANASLHVFNL